MTWAEYYDKFYDWSESTQISRLSSVRDFGPACEVCEIAEEFCDEKIASRLIRKALAAGVEFSSDEVSNRLKRYNAILLTDPALMFFIRYSHF